MVAASSAVNAPTNATVIIAASLPTNSVPHRAIMYTPAVTIVAAWISALTGVGPSIASGSHTYKGNCALFPNAPIISMNGIHAISDCFHAGSDATYGLRPPPGPGTTISRKPVIEP